MGIKEPGKLAFQDALRQLARDLDAAAHGASGPLMDQFSQLWGRPQVGVYRDLKKIGWHSGRKRRKDAGTTRMDDETLLEIAGALKCGVRKNGKATMETPNARALLAANGRNIDLSNGRINALLRKNKLDLRTQRQGHAPVSMRSLHPNHVHQVDPSLCLLYYTPGGEQRVISLAEAYKNKPEVIEKLSGLKLWRYVLTDHYSGSLIPHYYQAKGETQANLYDFLLWSWARRDGRPQHGVPKLLVWDKGSANTSAAIKNALHALQVETYEHQAGNPKAKGQVEKSNDLVEKLFESRLKYEPVSTVDELNAAAEAWGNAYNANAIPQYDSRLKRQGMTQPRARSELWLTIREDQLRILPDLDVCRWLLSADPKPVKVRADRSVTFKHPVSKRRETYDLRDFPDAVPRSEVLITPLIYGDHQVIVTLTDYKGDQAKHVLSPVPFDPISGQRLDSPVWGQEFKAQPDSAADKAGKAADKLAYPDRDLEQIKKAKAKNVAPFGGLDAHSHLKKLDLPDYLPRRGTALNVPDRMRVEETPLSNAEARRQLVGALGRPLSAQEVQWFRSQYPDGIAEDVLADLSRRLQGGEAMDSRPSLAVVK